MSREVAKGSATTNRLLANTSSIARIAALGGNAGSSNWLSRLKRKTAPVIQKPASSPGEAQTVPRVSTDDVKASADVAGRGDETDDCSDELDNVPVAWNRHGVSR